MNNEFFAVILQITGLFLVVVILTIPEKEIQANQKMLIVAMLVLMFSAPWFHNLIYWNLEFAKAMK